MLASFILAILLMQGYLVPFNPSAASGPDQSLAPNGDGGNSGLNNYQGTACSAIDCFLDVDDSPDSVDDRIVSTTNNGATYLATFPTPSSAPSTSAGAQTFQVIMSRCTEATPGVETTGGTNPIYDIAFFCNGSIVGSALATNVAITGLDQDDPHTFTFNTTDCASNGSDVEVLISHFRQGAGGDRRFACTEAIEWEVTH